MLLNLQELHLDPFKTEHTNLATMSSLCLNVHGMAGDELCTVDLHTLSTVRELKADIERLCGVPLQQQRLILGSSELKDSDVLGRVVDKSDFGSDDVLDITLVKRPIEQADWLRLAEENWEALLDHPSAWSDREVVIAAVSRCGRALLHADEEIRADRQVVIAAVKQNGLSLQYAAAELKADREVALEAISGCGRAIEFVGEQLRKERSFTLDAVSINGSALRFSTEFQRDHEVVNAAVNNCGPALAGAADGLRFLRGDTSSFIKSVLQNRCALTTSTFSSGLHTKDGKRSDVTETKETSRIGHRRDTFFFGGGRSDGHAGMSRLLGAHGAQLCEMANLGLPVSPGFCITKDCAGEGVKNALADVEQAIDRMFGAHNGKPLLLSVRSDVSAMDEVTNIGLSDDIAEAWALAESPHVAWDSYRRLIMAYSRVVKGLKMEPFEEAIFSIRQRLNEKDSWFGRNHQDCHIPASDLRDLVETYKDIYEDQVGEPFPQSPEVQLKETIDAFRRSLVKADTCGSIAVVQAMAFGNLDWESGSGVAVLDASSSRPDGWWLANAQREDVHAGTRTRQEFTGQGEVERESLEEVMPSILASLAHYQDVVHRNLPAARALEFVVERGRLWVSQLLDDMSSIILATPAKTSDRVECATPASPIVNELAQKVVADVTTNTEMPSLLEDSHLFKAVISGCLCDHGRATVSHVDVPEQQRATSRVDLTGLRSVKQRPKRQINARLARVNRVVHAPAKRTGPVAERWTTGDTGLVLPLWQTAVAGGSATIASRTVIASVPQLMQAVTSQGVASRLSGGSAARIVARNLATCSRAFLPGSVCCTTYVNLLHRCSPDGQLPSVPLIPRFACATTAATIGTAVGALSLPAFNSAQVGRCFSGICPALRTGMPVLALELCAIDVLSNVGTSCGFSMCPGLLLGAGAAAGAVAQSVVHSTSLTSHLLSPARQLIGASGPSPQVLAPRISFASTMRNFAGACAKHVPAAGVNSVVRVGLVTHFMAQLHSQN